jgi:NodT family efflux transporter outer membrane factor (OMF) lipoprotein
MKKTIKNISLILFIGNIFYACKSSQPLIDKNNIKTVEQLSQNTTDTASIADIKWKDFFKDTVLVNLIDIALKNNPDIQIAVQKIYTANAVYQASKKNLLPTLGLRTAVDLNKYGLYTINGIGNFDSNLSPNIPDEAKIPDPVVPDYFLGMQAAWEIDLRGKLRNEKKSAYFKSMASVFEKQLIQTYLINNLAKAYYELLALDKELEIVQDNIELQEKALELVIIQKAGGRANELAVKQFSAQLLNSQSLEYLIKQQITETENYINYLAGRFPQKVNRGDSLYKQVLPQQISVGLSGKLLQKRPDIQMAQAELFSGYSDVKAAKAAFYPSFTINAYGAFNAYNTQFIFTSPASLAYGALMNVMMPLLNRNQIMMQYNASIAMANAAFYNYQKTIYKGVEEVSTNLSRIDNYKNAATKKEEEVKALKSAVSISKDLFVTGYANYLEVIAAQKSVLESEIDLINLKKEQFFSLLDLYRALGGGW